LALLNGNYARLDLLGVLHDIQSDALLIYGLV